MAVVALVTLLAMPASVADTLFTSAPRSVIAPYSSPGTRAFHDIAAAGDVLVAAETRALRIYVASGSGWTQADHRVFSEPVRAVATDGQVVAVSTWSRLYILEREASAWTQVAILRDEYGTTLRYAASVDIYNGTIAAFDDGGVALLRIIDKRDGQWLERSIVAYEEQERSALPGRQVAISADWLVVRLQGGTEPGIWFFEREGLDWYGACGLSGTGTLEDVHLAMDETHVAVVLTGKLPEQNGFEQPYRNLFVVDLANPCGGSAWRSLVAKLDLPAGDVAVKDGLVAVSQENAASEEARVLIYGMDGAQWLAKGALPPRTSELGARVEFTATGLVVGDPAWGDTRGAAIEWSFPRA